MKATKDALTLLGFLALSVGFTLLQFFTRDQSVSSRQAVMTTFAVWVVAAAAATIFTMVALRLRSGEPSTERAITRFLPWAAVGGVIFGSVVLGPQLDRPGVGAYAIAVAPGALMGGLMLAVSIAVARGRGAADPLRPARSRPRRVTRAPRGP